MKPSFIDTKGEQVDKYRRHLLWRGADLNSHKPSQVQWELVTKPKSEGGLGVIKLRTQNEALLLKNLHKFFNKEDLPWVHLLWDTYYSERELPGQRTRGSFWWRDIMKLLDTFRGMAQAHMGQGRTIAFWNDLWNGRILAVNYPELLSLRSIKTFRLTWLNILTNCKLCSLCLYQR